MIPVMPFHTILLDNFRFIVCLWAEVLISVPKAKGLNMEKTARGSAQMLSCCSSAPAAHTSQLKDRAEEHSPTTSYPLKSPLCSSSDLQASSQTQTFFGPQESHSEPPTRRHEACAGALAQSHIHCWQVRHPSSSSPDPAVGSKQKNTSCSSV